MNAELRIFNNYMEAELATARIRPMLYIMLDHKRTDRLKELKINKRISHIGYNFVRNKGLYL